jgi:hypothetical protein
VAQRGRPFRRPHQHTRGTGRHDDLEQTQRVDDQRRGQDVFDRQRLPVKVLVDR